MRSKPTKKSERKRYRPKNEERTGPGPDEIYEHIRRKNEKRAKPKKKKPNPKDPFTMPIGAFKNWNRREIV